MRRGGLLLLLLAGVGWGAGPRFKDLFDPSQLPLRPYGWEEWQGLDEAAKLRAGGTDPSEWLDPPPDPPSPEDEERKKREEERRAKLRAQGIPDHPRDRFPGFHFDVRLRRKQAQFENMVQPASASKLEGIVKQLKVIDKAAAKFDRVVRKATEEYVQVREQREKATEWQVKQAIKKTGKPPRVVQVNPQLLAKYFRASKTLQRVLALQQSERQFEKWLLDRVGVLLLELSGEELGKPVAALARGLKDKDWSYRVRCATILGKLGDPNAVAAFLKALEAEKDPFVLVELIRIRAKRGGDGLMVLLEQRLDDPGWPVRATVVRALGRIRKKESIDLLLARMEKEDGRLLEDIQASLKRLTGKNYEARAEPWKIWWAKARAGWTPPAAVPAGTEKEARKQGGGVYFYGIKTSSKRIVFCIDVSGSMDFPLDGEGGKRPPRILTAKRELYQALTSLPEEAQFTILAYSVDVRVWRKKMQKATIANKKKARRFVERLQPAGGTNIHDALMMSLEVALTAGRGPGKSPEADTLFFMTDGKPTVGRVVDPHQILDVITKRNKMVGVTIHTVGVSREQNSGFLLNLARQNNGRYVAHK